MRSTRRCRRWRCDPKYFRYLTECAPNVPIKLGDARLTLGESADKYDLMILDAFSSDAIRSSDDQRGDGDLPGAPRAARAWC